MMAERLGFEPRKELPLCRFSRPVLSTAQPSLREQVNIRLIESFQLKRHTKKNFFLLFVIVLALLTFILLVLSRY